MSSPAGTYGGSMYLENLVVDAVDPQLVGRFWEAVLGAEQLTDEPAGYETRLTIEGGPVLDVCFQRVPELPVDPSRVQVEIWGGARHTQEVERLLGLGARHPDRTEGDARAVVLADPEGSPFGVTQDQAAYADTGILAALRLDSADTDRDAQFWSWLTGWTHSVSGAPRSLRHPTRLGPFLELCPEPAPKRTSKNRLHLDVRLETGDDPDDIEARIVERGGSRLDPHWGELPWRLYADPSGNEFCVLPART